MHFSGAQGESMSDTFSCLSRGWALLLAAGLEEAVALLGKCRRDEGRFWIPVCPLQRCLSAPSKMQTEKAGLWSHQQLGIIPEVSSDQARTDFFNEPWPGGIPALCTWAVAVSEVSWGTVLVHLCSVTERATQTLTWANYTVSSLSAAVWHSAWINFSLLSVVLWL